MRVVILKNYLQVPFVFWNFKIIEVGAITVFSCRMFIPSSTKERIVPTANTTLRLLFKVWDRDKNE